MRKALLVLILLVIIPQVALASWWNPISWFKKFDPFNKKTSNSFIINNEESKSLEEIKNQTTLLELNTDKIEQPKVKNPVPISQPSIQTKQEKTQPNQQSVTPISPQLIFTDEDYKNLYENVYNGYSEFRSEIRSELENFDKTLVTDTDKQYYKSLKDLLDSLSSDMRYLGTLEDSISKPSNTIILYQNKLIQLKNVHRTSDSNYASDSKAEHLQYAKRTVIDYIEKNKNELYKTSVHIEAARLLYLFDKLSDTKYSSDFESKKTQQETIEFANRFLIDQE